MKALILTASLLLTIGYANHASAKACGNFIQCGTFTVPVYVNDELGWDEDLHVIETKEDNVRLIFDVSYENGDKDSYDLVLVFDKEGNFEMVYNELFSVGEGKCQDGVCSYTRKGGENRELIGNISFDTAGNLTRDEWTPDKTYMLKSVLRRQQ